MEDQEDLNRSASEGKPARERPIWLRESTVQGAYDPDEIKDGEKFTEQKYCSAYTRPLQYCQKHVLLYVCTPAAPNTGVSAPLCFAKHLCVGRYKNSLDPELKSRSVKLSC